MQNTKSMQNGQIRSDQHKMSKKDEKPGEPANNVEAVAMYLSGLYPDGVPQEHWPLVQAVRSLAFAVDGFPEIPSLWKQYREALTDLDGLHAFGEDQLDEIITRLSAPVLDAEN
jgi:hypothetical protein